MAAARGTACYSTELCPTLHGVLAHGRLYNISYRRSWLAGNVADSGPADPGSYIRGGLSMSLGNTQMRIQMTYFRRHDSLQVQ